MSVLLTFLFSFTFLASYYLLLDPSCSAALLLGATLTLLLAPTFGCPFSPSIYTFSYAPYLVVFLMLGGTSPPVVLSSYCLCLTFCSLSLLRSSYTSSTILFVSTYVFSLSSFIHHTSPFVYCVLLLSFTSSFSSFIPTLFHFIYLHVSSPYITLLTFYPNAIVPFVLTYSAGFLHNPSTLL
jgi:hypothetical protein